MRPSFSFDQFQRYAVLRAFAEEYGGGGTMGSGVSGAECGRPRVLDVGGVSPGGAGRGGGGTEPSAGAAWLPAREILRRELGGRIVEAEVFALDLADCLAAGFIKGNGDRLPFKDGSFDIVAAMDVLEHVPPGKRAGFLGELGRVARGAVVVGAPAGGGAVERAEAVIAAAYTDAYGIEHQQLREHRENGLPRAEEVEAALAAGGFSAGVNFPFGSLVNWLFGQSLRSLFWGLRDTARFVEAVGRYMISSFNRAEFELPAYRRFWVYSRRAGQAELESWVAAGLPGRIEAMAQEFAEGEGGAPPSFPALKELVAEFGRREIVSAVVVSKGNARRLNSCLQHLLAQRVDFDLEVCVWQTGGGESEPLENWIQERFPGVRVLRSGGSRGIGREEKDDGSADAHRGQSSGGKMNDGLSEVLHKLRGGHVLLVAETVDLDAEAVARLHGALQPRTEDGLIVVRHRRRRIFTFARIGGRRSPFKLLAGRVPALILRRRSPWDVFVPPRPGRWAYGECLFFRRRAAFFRLDNPPRRPRPSPFFWQFFS